jgi:hypothetical protein
MAVNVAFYDEKRRRLVQHEVVPFPRQSAPFAAIELGLQWQSGRHRIPAPLWVVWDKIDDLGVFDLKQVDSDDFTPPAESILDDILACARKLKG